MNLIALDELRGLPGDSSQVIELDVTSTHIVWKYNNEQTWTNLIDLAALKGQDGTDGREVQFQTSETHIQWRYEGDNVWVNLIALSLLTGSDGTNGLNGSDGREVEFQTSDTHIQWRYEGDNTWTNLLAIELLQGLDGLNGTNGADGIDGSDGRAVLFQTSETHIQWRYEGETVWNNLISLNLLTGSSGEDGVDGREILLQTTDTHIQWQYVGSNFWTDLIALDLIQGEAGTSVQFIDVIESTQEFTIFSPQWDFDETTLTLDQNLNIEIIDYQNLSNPYNPLATIYYSGYGNDNALNSPQTGNTYGYEFYLIDGVTSTDLYFGISYFNDNSNVDAEIRVTYDVDIDQWKNTAIENESFFTDDFDERHIVYVTIQESFKNNNILIPAGSSNVVVEMFVIGNLNFDYDLGYFIGEIPEGLSILRSLDFNHAYTLSSGNVNYDYSIDIIQPTTNSFYYVLTSKDEILFAGQGEDSGTLESLGIGTGTYAFLSYSEDGLLSELEINGTLDEDVYLYLIKTNDVFFEGIILSDEEDDGIDFTEFDEFDSRYQVTSKILQFVLSNGETIELDYNKVVDSIFDKDTFYFDILDQIEASLAWHQIYTLEDFMKIDECSYCNYILMNDIILGNDYDPISGFDGILDGNNFSITLQSRPNTFSRSRYAIFRTLDSGSTIRNLVINVETYETEYYSGYLAGSVENDVTVENIRINIDSFTGLESSGLLFGYIDESSSFILNNIYVDIQTANLTNSSALIGYADASTIHANNIHIIIDQLFVTNEVDPSGLLFGFVDSSTLYLDNIFIQVNEGLISGDDFGGLIGKTTDSTIYFENITLNIEMTGSDIINQSDNVGGLIGVSNTSELNFNDIQFGDSMNSHSFKLLGEGIGGLIGTSNESAVYISNVVGNVMFSDNQERIGGLVGQFIHSEGQVDQEFVVISDVAVTVFTDMSSTLIGGLIGSLSGINIVIVNSTVNGIIFGDVVGGMIGRVDYQDLSSYVTLRNVESYVQITTSSDDAGGFIGSISSPIYDWNTDVYTWNGIIAQPTNVQIVHARSYAYFNATSENYGGFIGYIEGGNIEVGLSFSYSSIAGTFSANNVGGYIGNILDAKVSIDMSYSYGVIQANTNIGGFVGTVRGTSYLSLNMVISDLLHVTYIIYGFDLVGNIEMSTEIAFDFVKQLTEELNDHV